MDFVRAFFDQKTYTWSYVVSGGEEALIIDPVEPASCPQALQFLKDRGLELVYSLETHVHADHPSGAIKWKEHFPLMKVGIGEGVQTVQGIFQKLWNLSPGPQFDLLLKDGQDLPLGPRKVRALATPGHTPSCMCYLVDGALFVGDTLLMPDAGTGRCDFPGGDGGELYDSVMNKIYTLPPETKVYVGHDYGPGGREIQCSTTVGEQKKNNIHLKEGAKRSEYVLMRSQRDRSLSPPELYEPSVKANIFLRPPP